MAVVKTEIGNKTAPSQYCLNNNNITNNNNGAANQQSMAPSCCAGCQTPIKDRFIFRVIEQSFHQDCVRCVDCSLSLNERCYTFNGKLYCRTDYCRRFGPKCSACQEPIKPTELVQRLKENLVYHLNCFVCQDCKRHLQAGEQMHLVDEKRLLCKRDFMNIAASSQQQQSQVTSQQVPPSAATASNQRQHHQVSAPLAARPTNGHHHNHQHQHQHQHSHPNHMKQQHEEQATATDTLESGSVSSEQQGLGALLAGDELDELDELDDAAADEHESAPGDQSAANQHQQFASHYSSGAAAKGAAATTDELLKAAGHLVDCGDDLVDANGKRRGPRTTIKPKQLETLRRAFESAPKPSRHIREQLAAETGLNMRVIQVWFQNRRSKERRMKNSNGSARRFFRPSSRRIRVGPASANTPAAGAGLAGSGGPQQQSLIAGGRGQQQSAGAKGQQKGGQQQLKQQLSPMEQAGDHLLGAAANQQQGNRQHNSPSEFGGSSSGGFTYFSDSSNQGDAFAINTSAGHQQQQQYLANGPQELMAMETAAGGNQSGGQPQQAASMNGQARQQQQYGHTQPMKNTPPPTPTMYQGATNQATSQHMMLGPQAPQGHPVHPHAHLSAAGQMVQPTMGGLLGHPQGPSVVQW